MASKPFPSSADPVNGDVRKGVASEDQNEEGDMNQEVAETVSNVPELVENTTFFSQGSTSDESDGDFFDAKEDITLEDIDQDDELKNGSSVEMSEKKDQEFKGNVDVEKIDDNEVERPLPSSQVIEIKSHKNEEDNRKPETKNNLEKRHSDLWGTFEPDAIVTVVNSNEESPKISTTLSSLSSSASVLSQTQSVSTDWVHFEDKHATKRSHSSLGIETKQGSSLTTVSDTSSTQSKTDWVRFDDSPQAKRHQISQQFTGSSSVYSSDVIMSGDERSLAEADRQSVVTSSAISSHGSYSGSQEYFPLEVSPSSSSNRIAYERKTNAERKTFEDLVSAQHVRSTPTSSSEKLSSSRSDSRSVSSPTPASWVKFEQEILGASSSSSVSSENNSPVHKLSTDLNPSEKRIGDQATLPSTIFLGGGQHHVSQMDTLPSNVPLQSFDDVANKENSHLSGIGAKDMTTFVPLSPSPSNPFREDVIRQQQLQKNFPQRRNIEKGNPFLTDTQTGGSYSWETFVGDTVEPHKAQVPQSPGNPFRSVTHVTVHQPSHSGLYSPSVPKTQPYPSFDDVDFGASPPATANSGAELSADINNQFHSMSNQSKVVPTATVSPVVQIKSVDTAANMDDPQTEPREVPPSGTSSSGTSPTDFIQEYPREMEDPEQGWPLMLRFPDKKKLAGSREWKSVHTRLIEGSLLQFFNNREERDPFKEIPLQCNYEFSPLKLQPYDTMGKIHTIKLLYASFKERRKLKSKGFHTRVVAVEQLLKVGSQNYESFRNFIFSVNESLMKLSSFKSGGSHYHNDSITVTVVDTYRTLLSPKGDLMKQAVHVDIYTLAFLSGKAECAIGLNDSQVKGAEVVSKRDIIPNKTDEWIKMEAVELHKCCNKNVFAESRFIRFDPVDACRFKLLSFETKPKEHTELPLLVKAAVSGEDVHIQFRVDLLAPARGPKQDYFTCYDVMIRIPIPESLISYFRRRKRIGFTSIKAVIKSSDLIKKGSIKPHLLEISVGSAKYEHAFGAIVWRIEKLPERHIAISTTHIFLCTLDLKSGKNYSAARVAIPSQFETEVKVDYRTQHTTASRTTVRSLAVDSEKSPEKIIRYSAQYEYTVQVENKYVMGPAADGSGDETPQCLQQ